MQFQAIQPPAEEQAHKLPLKSLCPVQASDSDSQPSVPRTVQNHGDIRTLHDPTPQNSIHPGHPHSQEDDDDDDDHENDEKLTSPYGVGMLTLPGLTLNAPPAPAIGGAPIANLDDFVDNTIGSNPVSDDDNDDEEEEEQDTGSEEDDDFVAQQMCNIHGSISVSREMSPATEEEALVAALLPHVVAANNGGRSTQQQAINNDNNTNGNNNASYNNNNQAVHPAAAAAAAATAAAQPPRRPNNHARDNIDTQYPSWAYHLVDTFFHMPCPYHLDQPRDNSCNLYCLTCAPRHGGGMCKHCLPEHERECTAAVHQVYRYMHNDIIRTATFGSLLPLTDIQYYKANDHNAVHLRQKELPKTKSPNYFTSRCGGCNRNINPSWRFCSLACKLGVSTDNTASTSQYREHGRALGTIAEGTGTSGGGTDDRDRPSTSGGQSPTHGKRARKEKEKLVGAKRRKCPSPQRSAEL